RNNRPRRRRHVTAGADDVMYGTAELAQDMCGGDLDVQITNFVLQSQSRELPEPPETARNHFARQGVSGLKVFLVYFLKDPVSGESDPHWAIVAVEARAMTLVTSVTWDDARKCVEAEVLEDAAVETCETPQPRDVLCFEECLNTE
ncbi:MAG: hypothetical protein L0Z53_21520, partial [Acidobacteriales bacterium]|nr:hypothetical protein [Terriglobales bacterium]